MNADFRYYSPTSLKELFSLLKKEPESVFLAGGTDLLVNLRSGKLLPPAVIDLKRIKELSLIEKTEAGISVGALCLMDTLASSSTIPIQYELLKYAASIMGCLEIRNRATIGGNIVNASPGGETITPLAVIEALIVLRKEKKSRTVTFSEFIDWVNSTILEKGEIVEKIILPKLPSTARGVYMRRARVKGMDLASVNFSMLVLRPGSIKDRGVRIAMGTVMPKPYRAKEAEQVLSEGRITDEKIREAAELINASIAPRASSLRATPLYKRLMVETFIRSSLEEIIGKK